MSMIEKQISDLEDLKNRLKFQNTKIGDWELVYNAINTIQSLSEKLSISEPMTNADYIRQMSDEELAHLIYLISMCEDGNGADCSKCPLKDCMDCIYEQCIFDWLKQSRKVEE